MKVAKLSSALLMRKGTGMPVTVPRSHGAPAPHGQESHELQPALNAASGDVLHDPFGPATPAVGPNPAATGKRTGTRVSGIRGKTSSGRNKTPKRDHLGRVRLSLRLDPQRHRRLKLLSTHTRRSIQDTLIAALDFYLADQGRSVMEGACTCLTDVDQPPPADCTKPCHAKTKDAEGHGEPS